MRKIPCILFIAVYILLFVVSVNAQLKTPPVIEWQRSLGGSEYESAQSVQQTSDGGYIIAGDAQSFDGDLKKNNGGSDYWVVKLSSSGITAWTGIYGGWSHELTPMIRQAKDGSFIMTGRSDSDDADVKDHIGNSDFWLVKLTGSVVNWARSLGGSGYDEATSVIPTFDSGYIVVGYSASNDSMVVGNHGDHDCWVVKLASNGVTEWANSYGGSAYDAGNSIQQTSDSGYIIAGESLSNDGNVTGHHGEIYFSDYWIIKLSKEGSIEWQRSLGGSKGDYAMDIRQTADGGYITVGFSQSINGDVNGHFGEELTDDMWVVKLSSTGSIEWDRSLGGTRDDRAHSVCETTDRGYVIAGYTNSLDGNVSSNYGGYDYWLVKLSSSGILEWEKSFGGSGGEIAHSIQQTTDGGFIVAGRSGSNDGDVIGNHGGYDYWIVKLSPENPNGVEDEQAAIRSASIIPNPAQTTATLSLESDEECMCEVQIISVTGVTVKQYSTRIVAGKQEIELTDLESLPSGMYEVLVKRAGYLVSQTKLIIE